MRKVIAGEVRGRLWEKKHKWKRNSIYKKKSKILEAKRRTDWKLEEKQYLK